MAQQGLVWEKNLRDPAQVSPKWSKEPDIDAIRATAAKELLVAEPKRLEVVFLAEGVFNKVYRVCEPGRDEEYIMRVSLPVQPFYKTYTKVTTLEYLRKYTNLPLPRVLAYDASSDNLIGFEWILMTLIPGLPLSKIYLCLTVEQKRNIVKQMVFYVTQLFQRQFTSIGGLRKTGDDQYEIGRMVTIPFWWYRRVHDLSNKGPFLTFESCLAAQLQLMTTEIEQCYEEHLANLGIDSSHNESDLPIMLQNVNVLNLALPSILRDMPPPTTDAHGRILTALTHNDLAVQNILIDPNTLRVTGIVDWEDVSAQPLAIFCQLPHFLEYGSVGCQATSQLSNGAFQEGYGTADAENIIFKHLNPESNNDSILRNQDEELRCYFLEEMQQICPAWVEEHWKGAELRDILQVINSADVSTNRCDIKTWLSFWADGQKKTLKQIKKESEYQNVRFGLRQIQLAYSSENQCHRGKHDTSQIWTPAMLPHLAGASNNMRDTKHAFDFIMPDSKADEIRQTCEDRMNIHEARLTFARSVCMLTEEISDCSSDEKRLVSCSPTSATANPVQVPPSIKGTIPQSLWTLTSQIFAALRRAVVG